MKVTLTTLTSRYGSIDALNANFEALADAIENTLSLDGTTPNALEANLDANSNRIINLPSPSANSDAATKGYVDTITQLLNQYVDEIQTISDNIDDLLIAAAIDPEDLATVADNATNVGTVAGISGNVTTVAGISADVTAVADNETDISAVAANETNIDAVAANVTNINAAVSNATNINAVVSNATNINTVASNNTNITTVAGISSAITTVAGNTTDISTVASNIVDVQNAEENADAAIAAQAAAEAARDAALAALDSFDDRYLGQKTTDPSLDNDGNALSAGLLYFNTTSNVMKVYDGSAWLAAYASLAGALIATSNLSDLTNAASARTNLGLGTAATTAASAYATAAQGTSADTAYGWGNHALADYVTDTALATALDAYLLADAALAYYAADSTVVHKTGDETIAGVKTFSGATTVMDGSVGIGTSSPATYGGLVVQAATGIGAPLTLLTTDAGANAQAVFKGSRQYQIGTGNSSSGFAGSLFFYDGTAGVERMRIDASGNLILSNSIQEKKTAMAANDIDLSAGNYFTKTIGGGTTFTVSNVPSTGTAASFILDLTNGASASITWWANMKWAGGTAPTLTASGRDTLGFFTHDGGSTWTGLLLGKDIK